MKFLNVLVLATVANCVVSTAANAGEFRARTQVWVKIQAKPGEARWAACRRVFKHEVFRVRRGPGNTMWCYVDYHRAYN